MDYDLKEKLKDKFESLYNKNKNKIKLDQAIRIYSDNFFRDVITSTKNKKSFYQIIEKGLNKDLKNKSLAEISKSLNPELIIFFENFYFKNDLKKYIKTIIEDKLKDKSIKNYESFFTFFSNPIIIEVLRFDSALKEKLIKISENFSDPVNIFDLLKYRSKIQGDYRLTSQIDKKITKYINEKLGDLTIIELQQIQSQYFDQLYYSNQNKIEKEISKREKNKEVKKILENSEFSNLNKLEDIFNYLTKVLKNSIDENKILAIKLKTSEIIKNSSSPIKDHIELLKQQKRHYRYYNDIGKALNIIESGLAISAFIDQKLLIYSDLEGYLETLKTKNAYSKYIEKVENAIITKNIKKIKILSINKILEQIYNIEDQYAKKKEFEIYTQILVEKDFKKYLSSSSLKVGPFLETFQKLKNILEYKTDKNSKAILNIADEVKSTRSEEIFEDYYRKKYKNDYKKIISDYEKLLNTYYSRDDKLMKYLKDNYKTAKENLEKDYEKKYSNLSKLKDKELIDIITHLKSKLPSWSDTTNTEKEIIKKYLAKAQSTIKRLLDAIEKTYRKMNIEDFLSFGIHLKLPLDSIILNEFEAKKKNKKISYHRETYRKVFESRTGQINEVKKKIFENDIRDASLFDILYKYFALRHGINYIENLGFTSFWPKIWSINNSTKERIFINDQGSRGDFDLLYEAMKSKIPKNSPLDEKEYKKLVDDFIKIVDWKEITKNLRFFKSNIFMYIMGVVEIIAEANPGISKEFNKYLSSEIKKCINRVYKGRVSCHYIYSYNNIDYFDFYIFDKNGYYVSSKSFCLQSNLGYYFINNETPKLIKDVLTQLSKEGYNIEMKLKNEAKKNVPKHKTHQKPPQKKKAKKTTGKLTRKEVIKYFSKNIPLLGSSIKNMNFIKFKSYFDNKDTIKKDNSFLKMSIVEGEGLNLECKEKDNSAKSLLENVFFQISSSFLNDEPHPEIILNIDTTKDGKKVLVNKNDSQLKTIKYYEYLYLKLEYMIIQIYRTKPGNQNQIVLKILNEFLKKLMAVDIKTKKGTIKISVEFERFLSTQINKKFIKEILNILGITKEADSFEKISDYLDSIKSKIKNN